MSLSLKAELETWAAALEAYDDHDFKKALDLFSRIADSSKILTNIGLIYATISEHETAVEYFVAATSLDSYLAIAYFQCGVSNFLLQRYDVALLNFEDAHLYLRGNEFINYDQIGLKFKLFSAEILFNKGLTQINLGFAEQGLADMHAASQLKVTDEHGVIDEAIRDRGEGYTVFSIPVGVLYRPSENKLKNSKSKDYLGKAKLVAATDSNDAFTEFTGVVKLQQASAENIGGRENGNKSDVEPSALSRSATVPIPRTDPIVTRPTALECPETSARHRAGFRPNKATIPASRRSQSVSNPVNVPPPYVSSLSRSNTASGRRNATRLAVGAATSAGVQPLKVKTPHSAAGDATGIGTAGVETGTATGAHPMMGWPSLRKPKGQGVAQQSVTQLHQSPQHSQNMTATQGVSPSVPPAVQVPAQEGHLTQFYNSYIDMYMDDDASRPVVTRPSTAQTRSSASPSQRQSPAASSFYQQSQPQPQKQQQFPAWMRSDPSSVKTSSNSSTSSGMSRAPSRAASAGTQMALGMNQNVGWGMGINIEPIVGMDQSMAIGTANMGRGGINNAGAGTLRRKVTRHPTTRRVTVYDDDDGDDGFVTGEYEEFEMANIRVKLHYQGDVRGMAIPPTTSFREFVERVTAKFGTSLTGLGMKFADEDGTKISLCDESDFELAVETARESGKGRSEGKIEIWCIDV